MIFFAALCLVTGVALSLHAQVTRVIRTVSVETMRASAAIAVNEAIYDTLAGDVGYEELVTVRYGADGAVRAIIANAFRINRIARDAAYLSQQYLQEMGDRGVSIPLGAFTGLEAWAGFGPKIHVKIIPVASVTCRFASHFEEAGINRTRHAVYLEVTAEISVIAASRTSRFSAMTEVLVCETVIAGEVPETYLEADLFGSGVTVSSGSDTP